MICSPGNKEAGMLRNQIMKTPDNVETLKEIVFKFTHKKTPPKNLQIWMFSQPLSCCDWLKTSSMLDVHT